MRSAATFLIAFIAVPTACDPADTCVDKDCGEHGSCRNDDGICECESGFAGPRCAQALELCQAVTCGDHGSCDASNGQCVCDAEFSGTQCNTIRADALVAGIDDLSLDVDSFYNGSNGAGGFQSGSAFFVNNYDDSVDFWDGFSYSNVKDTTTTTYDNQYAAFAGSGALGSDKYAIAYDGRVVGAFAPVLSLTDTTQGYTLAGLHVCNTTITYLSMRDGDGYAKKFGGEDGTAPDWFLLKIFGIDASGDMSEPIDVYLADFRADDSSQDYIIADWHWVDLSQLGPVIGLHFELSSSDTGVGGMNTPAYFALDAIVRQISQ